MRWESTYNSGAHFAVAAHGHDGDCSVEGAHFIAVADAGGGLGGGRGATTASVQLLGAGGACGFATFGAEHGGGGSLTAVAQHSQRLQRAMTQVVIHSY